MKPENLIRLGAMCQKKYGMADDFRTMAVDGLGINTIRLDAKRFIDLEKIYFVEGKEYAWVGYSKEYNVLLLKGIE